MFFICETIDIYFIPDNRLRCNKYHFFLLAMLCTCLPVLYHYIRSLVTHQGVNLIDPTLINIPTSVIDNLPFVEQPPSMEIIEIKRPNVLFISTTSVYRFLEFCYFSNNSFE